MLCQKKFWFKIFLGANKISGLKILGPTKFWVWKKNLGLKKISKKKLGAKINFGTGKTFGKKL